MVKISELETDISIGGAEQLVVNDGGTTKKTTINAILAKQHDHTSSDVTDFDTAVEALIDVPNDTAKTTPVDTDVFALWDTIRKKVTWANIKATLSVIFLGKSELRTGLTASQILTTNGSGVEGYSALSLLPVVASDAEALAGTNQTKFINPKQAKDNYETLVNVVSGTRNSSGSENIAHGLSRTPKAVYAYYSDTQIIGYGFYADSVQRSAYITNSGQTPSTTQIISTAAGTNAVVNSIDSTNLAVTRTDTGNETTYRLVFIA